MTGAASPSLVVKVSFGSSLTRRVTFASAEAVYFEQFKEKIARCFSLEVPSFRIAYRDDDGDETEISNPDDLVEAISYFDDDERPISSGSSAASSTKSSKVTMKVRLLLEYDGPALSDAGSLAGGGRRDGTQSGWGDSRYSLESNSRRGGDGDDWEDDDRSSVASSSFGGGYDDRSGGRRGGWVRGGREGRGRFGRRGGDERFDSRGGGRGSPTSIPHQETYSAYTHNYAFRPPPPPPPPVQQYPVYAHPSSQFVPAPPPRPPPFYSQAPPWQQAQRIQNNLFEDGTASELSYAGPPGRPAPPPTFTPPPPPPSATPPTAEAPSGSAVPTGAVDDSRSSSSGSSSKASSVGRAGRRHRNANGSASGEPVPAPAPGVFLTPHSAPPTYTSGSSNGDVREELERRWFRGEDERLRIGGAGGQGDPKGKGRASSGSPGRSGSGPGRTGSAPLPPNGAYPRPPSRSTSDPEGPYASESEEDAFRYEGHLDENGAGPSSSQLQLGNGGGSGDLELVRFLADLSLSRMPAPSILSSVPDNLLRCCGCHRVMLQFRYICTLCGPILPDEQTLSDDGTQVEGREGDDDDDMMSDSGTVITLSEVDDDESSSQKPLLSDPLGVLDAAAAAGSNSPSHSPTSPKRSLESHDHSHDHSHSPEHSHSPHSSPVTPISPLTDENVAHPAGDIFSADSHDMAHHRFGEEERGGYELCSECVETCGVQHAAEMSRVAKERGLEEGESQIELRHSFGEVMRMAKSSLHGWREVDYEDDVHCTICGTGPVQTNRFKCLSCTKFELCLSCYRTVEEIHPVHSFLAVPDRPARPRAQSLASNGSGGSGGHATPEDMRLAFLRARGVVGSNGERLTPQSSNSSLNMPPRLPPKPMKHPGVLCFGCLGDIIGPRYSCAMCPSFDLCSKCEQLDPPITSPDGRHDVSHIVLKITVPVVEDWLVDEATDRARMMSREGSSSRRRRSSGSGRHQGHGGGWGVSGYDGAPYHPHPHDNYPPPPPGFGPPPPHYFGPPPTHHNPHGGPSAPLYVLNSAGQLQPQYGEMPLQPLALPGSSEAINRAVHQVLCRGCNRVIQGIRWLCAQCGSAPTFDLCSSCERSSHLIHNPLHCFLRITRPLQKALPPLLQLLPVLYDPTSPARFESLSSSGSSRSGSSEGINDAVVLHQNVLCDNCLEAICGPWMRCCHCSTSFDLCCECLSKIDHDPFHIFTKFTRRIDMPLFRELTRINGPHPQALLSFSIL